MEGSWTGKAGMWDAASGLGPTGWPPPDQQEDAQENGTYYHCAHIIYPGLTFVTNVFSSWRTFSTRTRRDWAEYSLVNANGSELNDTVTSCIDSMES